MQLLKSLLLLTVTVILPFFGLPATCLPTGDLGLLSNDAHDANDTTPKTSYLSMTRVELDDQHVCQAFYKIFFRIWVVQVPPSWWRERYNDDDGAACAEFKRQIVGKERKQRFMIAHWQECWRMDKKYPSGGVDWLHMRFLTSTFASVEPAESGIERARDQEHFHEQDLPLKCERPGGVIHT